MGFHTAPLCRLGKERDQGEFDKTYCVYLFHVFPERLVNQGSRTGHPVGFFYHFWKPSETANFAMKPWHIDTNLHTLFENISNTCD